MGERAGRDAAYAKRVRDQRKATGACIVCGETCDRKGMRCSACCAVMLEKVRYRRRLARIGDALLPELKASVRSGQPVFISAAQSKSLVALLNQRATPRPNLEEPHND